MRYLGLVALLLVSVACGSDGGGSASQEGVSSMGFQCGDRIDARAADAMVVGGEFPGTVNRGGDGTFTGTVTVTGTGPRITGVASPEADVYLAGDGEIVATALAKDSIGRPVDLDRGASITFTARGAVRPCAAGGGERLPAGRYDVFAVVVVNRDDGSSVTATGGPWPIDVA
jgi:hypothetical protein